MICVTKTHAGCLRSTNEDCVLVDNERGIYLLADGMGGHQGGETASQLAVDTAYAHLLSSLGNDEDIDIEKILTAAVMAAHQSVRDLSLNNVALRGMGTTLLIIVLRSYKVHICYVGDSRLYLMRDSLIQLTFDHTLGNLVSERKVMSHYKIPDHYWNILTQAIGIESELSPSVKSVRLAPSDKLLMCTDGLYRMLSCQEISSLIKQNAANVNTIVENLVNKAIEHGGEDNISVILIQHD